MNTTGNNKQTKFQEQNEVKQKNVFKNILEIWKGISFLEISGVFKDIVLAISEFYPLAQWRPNTAGHSHN